MSATVQLTDVDFPPLAACPADPEWGLGVSAQHTILRYFHEMLAQRQIVLDNTDLEGVHEIRVAARRCRTALQTFRALWDQADIKRFEAYLDAFATSFGVARDLDVMIIYLQQQLQQASGEREAALRWLLDRNMQARQSEQPQLEKALRRLEQDGFHLAFVAYFAKLPIDLWTLEGCDGEG